jgi:hypothetical protein
MSRSFYVIFITLTLSATVRAQTQKGNQLLGGSLSLATGKGTTTEYLRGTSGAIEVIKNKLNSFSIGPTYSFFVADNLDLGASLAYSTFRQSSILPNVASEIEKQRGFNYSVYLRKYFLFEKKVGFRMGPYVGYQNSKASSDFGSSIVGFQEIKNKLFDAGIGFDFVYFPTQKIGLAANIGTLGYQHITYTRSDDNQLSLQEKDHTFGLNLANSNLALSVFYSFGK